MSQQQELSYKIQRKNYRKEKQRVAKELTTALKDPSIVILSGCLKVRGKLKGWTKLWAVLMKPGLLLLYKGKVKVSQPRDGYHHYPVIGIDMMFYYDS